MPINQYAEMTTEQISSYMSGDSCGGQTKAELELIMITVLDRLSSAEFRIAVLEARMRSLPDFEKTVSI